MNQKTYHLGTLRIVATLDRVYSKLLDQLLRHLLVNGVKAFSLAIVILFILRELVTKHLSKMSQYAHTLRLDRLEIPLVLDKKKSSGSPPSHNELDDVVHSINKMRQSLLEGVNTMKQVEKERTHLLAQTQEMVQMRDDFISAASHELKTPATAMHLNLQLIQASFGKTMPGGLLKRFELLQRQEQRILDLIQTLFLTSALGTKEVELNLKMVNLSKLVKDSIEELSPIGTIQGCTLNSQIEPNIWACLDESRTKEIIVNLVSNALKFGKQNPIDISLRKEDQFAIITIRDYGIGIKEEDKSKIFEKYVRAASIMSFGGLGLGLYLTRKFVEAHSGKIWVESKRGQGTLFMVKLPLGTNATDDSNKLCEQ